MTENLVTIAAYARHVGVNASVISRAIGRGKLPHVVVDGRKMIDRAEADSARRRNGNISRGHGGRPDRCIRQQSRWKARSTTGFDPAVAACLDTMRMHWPTLLAEAMELLGSNEIDQARAVLALNELVEWLSCTTHQDINRAGNGDYRDPLEPIVNPDWTDAEARVG